ncbi:Target of rapamycin [Diplonema papillatum]|nr:Target of rapamycin [Diplonema papillatum]
MQTPCVCCDGDAMRVACQVHRIAVKLANPDERLRHRAAAELRTLHDMTLGESAEVLKPFLKTLHESLTELATSKQPSAKLGVAEACLELAMAIHLEASQVEVIRQVIHAVLDTTNIKLATVATQALCALTKKSAATEIVEVEANRCKEWLTNRREDQGVVACVVLKGLADSAHEHMVPHASQCLKLLWNSLRKGGGPEFTKRAASATSELTICLLKQDQEHPTVEGFSRVLLTHMGTNASSFEQLASISILCELVKHYPEKLLNVTIASTMSVASPLSLKNLLVARIAETDPSRFDGFFQASFTSITSSVAARPNDEGTLKALQVLIKAALRTPMGTAVLRKLVDPLLKAVQSSHHFEAAKCLILVLPLLGADGASRIARATQKRVIGFPAGSRGSLLAELSAQYPKIQADIETNFMHLTAKALQEEDSRIVTAALQDLTQVTFSTEEDHVKDFLSTFAAPCGRHKLASVRRIARKACLSVARGLTLPSIIAVLDEIATTLVSDLDVENRTDGLRLLKDFPFKQAVADKKVARTLCVCLMDVSEDVRRHAVELLSGLCELNPSAIAPKLDSDLRFSYQTLLHHPCVHHQAEGANHVGYCLPALKACNWGPESKEGVIDAASIMDLLTSRLRESSPRSMLQYYLLTAICRVVDVDWRVITAHAAQLIPLLVKAVQDQDLSQCTQPAVAALGKVLQVTGDAYQVFHTNHGLYNRLLSLLHHSRNARKETRLEVMRLMGVLGAVDPTAARRLQLPQSQRDVKADVSQKDFSSVWTSTSVLLEVLAQPWNAAHHDAATEAIVQILRILGPKRAALQVPRIVPAFLLLLEEKRQKAGESTAILCNALAAVLGVEGVAVGDIQPFAAGITSLISDLWAPADSQERAAMAGVIGELHGSGCGVGGMLESFLPRLSDAVLRDRLPERPLALTACALFEKLKADLKPHVHTAVICLMSLLPAGDHPSAVRLRALQCVQALAAADVLGDTAVLVVQALMQQLSMNEEGGSTGGVLVARGNSSAHIKTVSNNSFGSLNSTKSEAFATYYSEVAYTLKEVLERPSRSVRPLRQAALDMLRGYSFYGDEHENGVPPSPHNALGASAPEAHRDPNTVLTADVEALRSAISVPGSFTHGDFVQWYDKLCLVLLRESTRSILRAVAVPAAGLPTIGRALLNVSFAVCYRDFQYEKPAIATEMIDHLQSALQSDVPEEVLQPLLDLSDYLERFSMVEERLDPAGLKPQGHRLLRLENTAHQARLAEMCGLHTKALRLAECCDISDPPIYRQLVRVNVQLGLPEAAEGIMRLVQKSDIEDGGMYADLGLWNEALVRYEAQLQHAKEEELEDTVVGLFTALDKQGAWGRMLECVDVYWVGAAHEVKQKLAPMIAHGAWLMSQWELLEESADLVSESVTALPGSFYKAVLSIQKNDLAGARAEIERCRQGIDSEMATSSYHAYSLHVTLQHLTELEEIISYKSTTDNERKLKLKALWSGRVRILQLDPRYLRDALTLRTLVTSQGEDADVWVDFASTCHKLGSTETAQQVLQSLAHDLPDLPENFKLAMAEIQWDLHPDRRHDLIAALASVVDDMRPNLRKLSASRIANFEACCIALSRWRYTLGRPLHETLAPLKYSIEAHDDYTSWNEWALLNLRAVFRETSASKDRTQYLQSAILGFKRCVELSPSEQVAMQDALRLVHIAYFNVGLDPEQRLPYSISDSLHLTCMSIRPSIWALLIPQIVGRLEHEQQELRKLSFDLTHMVATTYPQAVLFHLLVERSSKGAGHMLSLLAAMHPRVAAEAEIFSKELVRVTVSWEEKWIAALAKIYSMFTNGEATASKVRACLKPLFEQLSSVTTVKEKQFVANNKQKLIECNQAVDRWIAASPFSTGNDAKTLFVDLWRTLHRSLPTTLDLREVSPRLAIARNLSLLVPGRGVTSDVTIRSFDTVLPIIPSVQRPRKLTIVGSNGASYRFLLKGNEDLRLDERIMQLLSMANIVLRRGSLFKHVDIITYPVIAVAKDAGLIGWVDDTEDLEYVITHARQRGQRDVEMQVVARHFRLGKVEWDALTVDERVEALAVVEQNTTGDTLQLALWLRAATSEVWLERRTAFTQSLAVMSTIGYLIGLGDRHLGNILLHGPSGRVVHIDFGECFEAAMQRAVYPERVPFRLTRQLRNAMGVGGPEGVYRRTAIGTTTTLRNFRQAILPLLEPFVYDPLIQWKMQSAQPASRLLRRIQDKLEGSDAYSTPEIIRRLRYLPATYPTSLYTGRAPRRDNGDEPTSEASESTISGYLRSLVPPGPKQKCYPSHMYSQDQPDAGRVLCPSKHWMKPSKRAKSLACGICGVAVPRDAWHRWCTCCVLAACDACVADGACEFAQEEETHRPCDTATDQVDRLIADATSLHNLASLYKGWRPWL